MLYDFRRGRRFLAIALLAFFAAAPALCADYVSRARRRQAEAISARDLRRYLAFIASDALQGRDTPSPGLDAAAEFLAFHLERFGLQPAGDDGTYFQRIKLVRSSLSPAECAARLGERELKIGEDAAPSAASVAGHAAGALVYVSHGWQVPSKGIDAYQGVDVRGKVLVLGSGGLPEGMGFRDLQRLKPDEYLRPEAYAARHGAVGLVRLTFGDPESGSWAAARSVGEGGRPGFQPEPIDPPASVPSLTLSPGVSRDLLAGEALSYEAAETQSRESGAATPVALSAEKRIDFTVARKVETATTQNVVALWRGADKRRADEYVALGAHYDHVGVGGSGTDRIFNGADDDGSGTVALLAIAQALAEKKVKTKRSLLFVWHCGEEKGLWGSARYTDRPTVPLDKIVAQLNIDMIGRSKRPDDANPRNADLSGPAEVYLIGAKMLSRQFGAVVTRVNEEATGLSYNYRYDDPADPNRFYYRSDHYNYARKGIPIAFWFDGVHEDYHRPGDQVEKIDFAKMERVTRTVFLTALAVADLPERPAVDRTPER